MNTLRPVRLRIAWQDYAKGHVFTAMPAASAQDLVQRGLAEYVEREIDRAPVDRMLRPRRPAPRAS